MSFLTIKAVCFNYADAHQDRNSPNEYSHYSSTLLKLKELGISPVVSTGTPTILWDFSRCGDRRFLKKGGCQRVVAAALSHLRYTSTHKQLSKEGYPSVLT